MNREPRASDVLEAQGTGMAHTRSRIHAVFFAWQSRSLELFCLTTFASTTCWRLPGVPDSRAIARSMGPEGAAVQRYSKFSPRCPFRDLVAAASAENESALLVPPPRCE